MLSGIIGAATGLIGAAGARSAGRAQERAADQQAKVSREIFNRQTKFLQPYREAGEPALGAMNYLLGLGEAPIVGGTTPEVRRVMMGGSTVPSFDEWARQKYGGMPDWEADSRWGWKRDRDLREWQGLQAPQYQYEVGGQTFATQAEADAWARDNQTGGTRYSFETDPGYQFRLNEGLEALQASSAMRHGLHSGATMQALQRGAQDYASNEFGNVFNRLSGMANIGQSAAAGTAAAAGQYGANMNNALANMGDARAAGAVGVTNALTSGINNGLGVWAYQNARRV